MNIRLLVCLILIVGSVSTALAQQSGSGDAQPSSWSAQQSVPGSVDSPDASDAPSPRTSQPGLGDPEISWKRLAPLVVGDQRRIFSFPLQVLRGKHWVPVAAVLATTAALLAVDAPVGHAFHNTNTLSGFNQVFSGNNMALATLATPVAFYATGLVRKDSYAQQTALLAGEAVADSEILTTILKDLDRRLRPGDVPPQGNFSDTWFEGKLNSLGGNGSFPSGHTIAAFSVATVIAERYRTHRWVPYVAYSAAARIGFSRLSLSSHFPSDVFVGAALGYSITHFIVLRR